MASNKWIPIESNPEVLNAWANKAGLIKSQAQFEDVYGLDPELLAMVSRPVKAVILLFPITESQEEKRKEEDKVLAAQTHASVDPTVFFIKQTIPNACGTIGLLHALLNSNVTFAPQSPLERFIEQGSEKSPEERARILEETTLFADIHAEVASAGQTAVPENLDTDLHFTCFVQAPSVTAREDEVPTETMRLIELDGRRQGPIDRGECKDILLDVAKLVKEQYVSESTSMKFSMLSLGHPPKD